MPQAGSILGAKLLGQPQLFWESESIRPRSQKAMGLILYLAVRCEPVSRRELTELFWGFDKKHNLRQELYHVRQLPGAYAWLQNDEAIKLKVSSDYQAFQQAMQTEQYDRALDLWHGPLLAGFEVSNAPAFNDWLQVERLRAEDLLRRALRGQVVVLKQQDEIPAALELTNRLLKLDPLDESAYRTAMRLHYQLGDSQQALQVFETCRRMMLEELGVEPLEETVKLAREITRHHPLIPGSQPKPDPQLPLRLLRPPRLIGRDEAWAQMEVAWRANKPVYVGGQPGMGKTRLMLDFARSKGTYLLTEGRPGDTFLPYSSLGRALNRAYGRLSHIPLEHWVKQELARIIPQHFPALDVPPLNTFDVQPRFVEGVWQFMRHIRGAFSSLPADNIQFYDPASAQLILMLTMRFAETSSPATARLLVSFRKDELSAVQREGINAQCEAGIAELIELRPLNVRETVLLLDSLEIADARSFAPHLHRYTGGNPMFIMETLKSMHLSGELSSPVRTSFMRTHKTDGVLRQRLEQLSTQALRVARAVAVAQPRATPDLLALMLNLSVFDIADLLGELERDQLLLNGRFIHDLLHETVLAHTPPSVLKLLHFRAAEVLGTLAGEPARIAQHWHKAGESERAVRWWLVAGEAYRSTGLHAAAVTMLQHAAQHATKADEKSKAQIALARTLVESASYADARALLEPLLQDWLDPSQAAQAYRTLALAHLGEGRLENAGYAARQGMNHVRTLRDSALHRELQFLQARIAHRAERNEEAADRLEPLLEELRRQKPDQELVVVLSELAAVYDGLHRFQASLPLHREALELARKIGAKHLQVMASNHLLYNLLEANRASEGIELAEDALKLGHYHFSDLLRVHLVRAYLQLEQYERAKAHAEWLTKKSADAALRTAAWARIAEVCARSNSKEDTEAALDHAIAGLAETDFMRAHARVVISVLRYGSPRQIESIHPFKEKLASSELPSYLTEELKSLWDGH